MLETMLILLSAMRAYRVSVTEMFDANGHLCNYEHFSVAKAIPTSLRVHEMLRLSLVTMTALFKSHLPKHLRKEYVGDQQIC